MSFNSDGGTAIDSQTVEHGNAAAKPTDPTKTGYSFAGWQLGGADYNFETPVTAAIELTAKWEINKYTVTFNSDGGTAVEAKSVNYNSTVTKPADPTKEGYTFTGWQLNGEEYDFNTPVTAALTLTAKWEINQYTVSFDSDGGSEVAAQSVQHNGKAVEPAAPEKEGFTFVSWQLNGADYDFETAVTKAIELKAVWETEKFTVSFDSDGGSAVAAQRLEKGAKASKPANPTKDGCSFVSWQLNGADYNFAAPVTQNVELKAKWKINTYTVTFNSDGGSSVAAQTVDYKGKAVKPDDPTKDLMTFNGWTLNGEAFDFSTPITENLELKATWQPRMFTIVFINGANGQLLESVTVAEGSKTPAYSGEIPVRDGYRPNGWMPELADTVTDNAYYTMLWTLIPTGWQNIAGKTYYYDKAGEPVKGLQTIDGEEYLFDNTTGVMQTGWQKISGKWYFFDKESGEMHKGWLQDGGKWYYLDPTSGVMQTGWHKIDGKWYYFASSGARVNGWQKIGGKWYFFNESGVMQTGWLYNSRKWYYLNGSGAMAAVGWKMVLLASQLWRHAGWLDHC